MPVDKLKLTIAALAEIIDLPWDSSVQPARQIAMEVLSRLAQREAEDDHEADRVGVSKTFTTTVEPDGRLSPPVTLRQGDSVVITERHASGGDLSDDTTPPMVVPVGNGTTITREPGESWEDFGARADETRKRIRESHRPEVKRNPLAPLGHVFGGGS